MTALGSSSAFAAGTASRAWTRAVLLVSLPALLTAGLGLIDLGKKSLWRRKRDWPGVFASPADGRVWLVVSHADEGDAALRGIVRALSARYALERRREFKGIEIELYERV